MYYFYVEIDYVAMSFSPARTDLNVKLLTVNASLQHRSHSKITLSIVEEPTEETFNDIGILLLILFCPNITPGVETNVFQQSNLTQSYEDEYEDIQQIEDFVASTFDSDNWVNNDEELKEDMDDIT
jgi:hypothetical protein